jgi:hypothetical protein
MTPNSNTQQPAALVCTSLAVPNVSSRVMTAWVIRAKYLPFPNMSSGLNSLVRQNHCIFGYDAYDPALAHDICWPHIEVATQTQS